MTDRIEVQYLDETQPVIRHERSDAAANRALILQTAERLFAERGVANVCMADIAAAAGVGKGTLYRRFSSKGELCLSLMDRQMSEFQNETLARFQEQGVQGIPYLERLAYFLESLVDFTEFHSPLLIEVQRDGVVQGDVRLNLPHFWQYTTVRALLRSAGRNGEVDEALDLDYLSEALLAPLHVDTFGFQRRVRGYSTQRIGAGLRELVGLLAA